MPAKIDFESRPRRSRVEAWVLDATAPGIDAAIGDTKREAIGAMTGTVVEIGAGTGVNMSYYAPGVKVIAIEPNPHMHDRLRAKADRSGVDLTIRTLRGERIDLADESADGVVGTLVLCGVDDPAQVVAEVQRILRPGGVYFFAEHVVAPAATWTRRIQRAAKRPHRWAFNGCEVDRDLAAVINDGGFSSVDFVERDAGVSAAYVRHQIIGTATK